MKSATALAQVSEQRRHALTAFFSLQQHHLYLIVGHALTQGRSSLLAAAGDGIGTCRTILQYECAADANMQLCSL